MDEGYISTGDGVKLQYRAIGEGKTTLVIPGKCYVEDDFAPLADDFRLVFFDPRGRGGSDPVQLETASIDRQANDIEAVRAGLSLEGFSLLGWSYLSLVTALYAARNPGRVNRLIMVGVDSVRKLNDAEVEAQMQQEYTARIEKANAKERAKQLRESGIEQTDPERYAREYLRLTWELNVTDPSVFDRMKSNPSRHANEYPSNIFPQVEKMMGDLGSWDYTDEAKSMTCPTLVIHGVEDLGPMVGAESWVENLPDARLIRVSGSGHWPWFEAPDVFFPAVRQFLNGRWPEAAVEVTA